MYRYKLTAQRDLYQGKIKKGMVVYVLSETALTPNDVAIQNAWKNMGIDVPVTCCQIGQYKVEYERI